MNADWTRTFIGIPYRDFGRDRDGCDCWGLIRLVYRECLGVELPGYEADYSSTEERREIAALIATEARPPSWLQVDGPEPFDVLVFRQGRYGSHVAVHVAPGLMLHMAADDCAKIARTDAPVWAARRLGVYRRVLP